MQVPDDTARLGFAPLTAADASFLRQLVNEPGWIAGIGQRNIHDDAAALAYIANGPAASYAQHGYGLYRVALKATGEPVGVAGLVRRESLPGPDLGYALLGTHEGRGLATEAAMAVLAFARDVLKLGELLAITTPGNAGSIRVLAKCGFTYARTQHDAAGVESRVFLWKAAAYR
jgi:RimJ/RimL family protein N-acetyltransferase